MHLCHVIAFFLWCVYPLIFPLLIVTVIVAEAKCEPQLLISALSAAYVTVAGFTTLRGTGNSLRIPSYKWVRPIQLRPFLSAVLHKPLTAYFVEKIEIIRWKLYVLFAHLRWSKTCLLASLLDQLLTKALDPSSVGFSPVASAFPSVLTPAQPYLYIIKC